MSTKILEKFTGKRKVNSLQGLNFPELILILKGLDERNRKTKQEILVELIKPIDLTRAEQDSPLSNRIVTRLSPQEAIDELYKDFKSGVDYKEILSSYEICVNARTSEEEHLIMLKDFSQILLMNACIDRRDFEGQEYTPSLAGLVDGYQLSWKIPRSRYFRP